MDLCIEPGQSLGLMIRGGVEYNLGIFITGVDKDSVADRAGLMVNTYLGNELPKSDCCLLNLFGNMSEILSSKLVNLINVCIAVSFGKASLSFTCLRTAQSRHSCVFAPIHFPLDLARLELFVEFSVADAKTAYVLFP